MSLHVDIQTIPHGEQRYPTVGDYWTTADGVIHIRVSALGNWRMELLVAIHELIEKAICSRDGIAEKEIDQFDIEYENHRALNDFSEPGDSPLAPYHDAHILATLLEGALAIRLGVDWKEYDRKVREL